MNSRHFPKYYSAIFIVGAWFLVSTMQTIHFYYYFDQSLWNSVRWSFRDWFVWFTLFAAIYHLVGKQVELYKPSVWTLLIITFVAVISGFLQVLIITSLDFIQGTASRPFWDDFWHFYNKRWFQYLFVFTVFWLIMSLYISRQYERDKNIDDAKIKVNDGKQVHWLVKSDIESVEAAGNYVCINGRAKQILIRSTIKDIQTKLGNNTFLRVNRSNIVNVSAIESCHRAGRNKLELKLNSGTMVNVGSTYKKNVETALNL